MFHKEFIHQHNKRKVINIGTCRKSAWTKLTLNARLNIDEPGP